MVYHNEKLRFTFYRKYPWVMTIITINMDYMLTAKDISQNMQETNSSVVYQFCSYREMLVHTNKVCGNYESSIIAHTMRYYATHT